MQQNDLGESLSYYEFLFKYKGGFIFDEEYVPFWFKTLIGLLEVLGPETDSDLVRISQRLCAAPSYVELHKLSQPTMDQIVSIRGPHYKRGENTIDLKYMMINDLLWGVEPERFDSGIWLQHVHFALEDELDYEDHMPIMDEHLRKAVEGLIGAK